MSWIMPIWNNINDIKSCRNGWVASRHASVSLFGCFLHIAGLLLADIASKPESASFTKHFEAFRYEVWVAMSRRYIETWTKLLTGCGCPSVHLNFHLLCRLLFLLSFLSLPIEMRLQHDLFKSKLLLGSMSDLEPLDLPSFPSFPWAKGAWEPAAIWPYLRFHEIPPLSPMLAA